VSPSRRVFRLALVVVWLLLVTAAPTSAFAAPVNDNFGAARSLASAASGAVTGSNVDATKETGEPDHAGNPGGHSVWFSWTAPADGNAFFTTSGSAFDTLLAVYTGVAVNSLTPVAANDDDPTTGGSTVSFAVSSGVTYMLAVDGFLGKIGHIRLSWGRAPANDNFVDAQTVTGATGRTTGTVRGATAEPGEPSAFGLSTIWYSWTAPADGTYKFDTVGSNFDTVLAVYEGSSLDSLQLKGINDDDPDRGCCSSWVPIRNATAGTTYSISISDLGAGFPSDSCRFCALVVNWSPLILGGAGPETLLGTAGNDEIRGQGGADVLRGGGGNDTLFGGSGNDREYGGAGNDGILDRRGTDQLFGQAGNDRLNARDFVRGDVLSGGLGSDVCRGDTSDVRRGCP
jgi:Ca2+-binding RTX toxin-like protein